MHDDASLPQVDEILPLAPLQEGFLFHALFDEDAPDVYTSQLVLHVDGVIDPSTLRASIQTLVARHASLRAGFVYEGVQTPLQVIPRVADVPVTEIDVRHLAADARAGWLEVWLESDRRVRFDLQSPPLLRVALLQFATGDSRLVLTWHHILLDGWSIPLVMRELMTIYESGGRDTALSPVTPYRDYLAWVARQDSAAARHAWRRALEGLSAGTRIGPSAGTPQEAECREVAYPFTRTQIQHLGIENACT